MKRALLVPSCITTLAIGTWALAAPAQARGVEIRTTYRAPAGCPAQSQLEARITARSERVRITTQGRAELEFDVRVEPGWRAQIEVRDRSGERSSREISGETCREVVEAAALIVAVLADPDAAAQPPTPAPVPPDEPRGAPASAAPPEAEPPPAWRARAALGIGLSLETAPAPDPVLAARPLVALELRGPSFVHPALRVSAARASSGSITTSSGVAELIWTTARLEGCAAVGTDRGASAQACALFELGTLRGRGFRTNDPNDETVLWLAPGALARGGYGLEDVLRLELHAGLVFPLRRYRFYFGPDETAHRVPGLGVTAGLGIAVLLP